MDLSIIIVSYNTKNATKKAVESCLDEGSNIGLEVIIVDNGSKDKSYEFLKEIFSTNNNVTVIKNENNLGFSKAVNIGLERSKGNYKLLLNSDTKMVKGSFEKLISFVKTDDKIGVVGTKLILPDGSIQKSCFNFPTVKNVVKEFYFGQKEKYSPYYKNVISQVDAVVGASFLITPDAFKAVGLFDERYFMYFEDIDYCRRVNNKGFKVIYNPKVAVYHHHGLSGKKETSEEDQWRRLIPSSIIYNGRIKHFLINTVIWTGQLIKRF